MRIRKQRIAILSDVHYAGPAEQERGNDYEVGNVARPIQRVLCRAYRQYLWLRDPLHQNHLLDPVLALNPEPDHVFALGDYTCDTAFLGVSDDAALESAAECLGKLRSRFGDRLHPLIGDHELGKFSLFGNCGGLRLESWRRVRSALGLSASWQLTLGPYVCLGITSTLVALPAFQNELLETERADWERERRTHLEEIRQAFHSVSANQRILLFCHDPTALPYLATEPVVNRQFEKIERTFIGHLHSPFILWTSRRLAGMPSIGILGHTVKRLSTALARARHWKPFRVCLCPSLAGIQLLKDGGFLTTEIDARDDRPLQLQRHRIRR